MVSNSDAISVLSELAHAAEQYYKWANQFDLRIEDMRLRSAIARAKTVVQEHASSNN